MTGLNSVWAFKMTLMLLGAFGFISKPPKKDKKKSPAAASAPTNENDADKVE